MSCVWVGAYQVVTFVDFCLHDAADEASIAEIDGESLSRVATLLP